MALFVSEEFMRAQLQAAAGENRPILAMGYGYVGPSLLGTLSVAGVVLVLGQLIAWLTFRSWSLSLLGLVLAAAVAWIGWRRVRFMIVGVSPQHYIVIDLDRKLNPLPPARLGLSAIQNLRLATGELTYLLKYTLGDGTLHAIRFLNLPGHPDNREAARRIKDAILDNL